MAAAASSSSSRTLPLTSAKKRPATDDIVEEIDSSDDESSDSDSDVIESPADSKQHSAERQYERALLKSSAHLTFVQRSAVEWMSQRENKVGGGLLTDEMGLGKTTSLLYMIARDKMANPDRVAPVKTTLVVCPPILFSTWEKEIQSRFKPGLLRVARYGDPNVTETRVAAEDGHVPWKHNDIVLVSYNRLFLDLKAHLSNRRVGTKLNESDEQPPTVAEWLLTSSMFRRVERAFTLREARAPINERLATVSAPIASRGLFSVPWFRVVLDEAHKACSSNTATWRAAMCLAASRRWWVTGTPIQNRAADIVTALLFLREPSVCTEEGTDAAPPAQYRTDVKMTDQEFRATRAYQDWAMGRSVQELMDKHEELVASDPVLAYATNTRFNRYEHAIRFRYRQERDAHMKHVNRLRRVAQILSERGGEAKSAASLDAASSTNKRQKLSLTTDDAPTPETAKVDAEVDALLKKGSRERDVLFLYYMRARQVAIDLTLAGEPPLPNGANSTKIQMLIDDIRDKVPVQDKFIVFSEWVRALEITTEAINRSGVARVLILHGQTPKRQEVIERFQTDPSIRGLVAQVDCIGHGLTLVQANHVFKLGPMLNPMHEDQADKRVYRPGQTKDVNVYWLMIAGSIDEIVRSIGTKKRQLAQQVQGRGRTRNGAASSFQLLSDINEMLLNENVPGKYAERDGEREYRLGQATRRTIEVPPQMTEPLSRRQLELRHRAFLGAFVAFERLRLVPSASLVWNLENQQSKARAVANALPSFTAKPGPLQTGGGVLQRSYPIALDPIRLRRWLFDEFFTLFEEFELERRNRSNQGIREELQPSNYAQLVQIHRQTNGILVDVKRANQPADFLRLLSHVACPILKLHYLEEVLVAERHVFGVYNARNITTDLLVIKGDAMERVQKQPLYTAQPVLLHPDVLLAYSPFWLKNAELAATLPMPHVAYTDRMFEEPQSLWFAPAPEPVASASASDTDDVVFSDRSVLPAADSAGFLADVRDLLLPALVGASRSSSDGEHKDSEQSRVRARKLATCLLMTLLCVPCTVPMYERRLFVARRRAGRELVGVASAILVRAIDRPGNPVRLVMSPMAHALDPRIEQTLCRRLVDAVFLDKRLKFVRGSDSTDTTTLPHIWVRSADASFIEFLTKNMHHALEYIPNGTSMPPNPKAPSYWYLLSRLYGDGAVVPKTVVAKRACPDQIMADIVIEDD
jgi:hypothetical protein